MLLATHQHYNTKDALKHGDADTIHLFVGGPTDVSKPQLGLYKRLTKSYFSVMQSYGDGDI